MPIGRDRYGVRGVNNVYSCIVRLHIRILNARMSTHLFARRTSKISGRSASRMLYDIVS